MNMKNFRNLATGWRAPVLVGLGILFFEETAMAMSNYSFNINWDYVITTCRQQDDWFALYQGYDPHKTDEVKGIQDFSFIENGATFKYYGQRVKYANDTKYISKIEIAPRQIQVWVDPEISGEADGYTFTNVKKECHDDFIKYMQARPNLAEKMTIVK